MSASAVNMEKVVNRRRFDSNSGRVVTSEQADGQSYFLGDIVNMIHDFSQAYTNTAPVEDKEPIVWAKYFTYSDALGYEDMEDAPTPLLLLLGYPTGMQMWNLMSNGEAQEMFSLRDGPVKTACLLPPPPPLSGYEANDIFADKRPLMAICLATDSKQVFASVSIQSLRNGDQVKKLKFSSDVISVHAGPAPLFVITLVDTIHAYDANTLECLYIINDCYPGTGFITNPIALGSRWLAYSPSLALNKLQSAGGITGAGTQSYVTTMLNAAKKIGSGISVIGNTVQWLAEKSHLKSSAEDTASSQNHRRSASDLAEQESDNRVPGLVAVLDTWKMLQANKNDKNGRKQVIEIDAEKDADGIIIAHFVAHVGQSVAFMEWGPSGKLLATADVLGHAFHVFSILPHPGGSPFGAVHHLYTLWRGETLAQVQELRFSWDSRWLTASTLRGTCHIFPIAPYGGQPNVRTHTSNRLVNRASTFHTSAGLNDVHFADLHSASSRFTNSPTHTSYGVLSSQSHHWKKAARSQNPRFPPFPFPVKLQALVRLGPKASANVSGVLRSYSPTSSSHDATPLPPKTADVAIATRFLQTGERIQRKKDRSGTRSNSSLGGSHRILIISSSGYLTEYLLEPRPAYGTEVAEDTPVELQYTPQVRWPLQRQASWPTVPLNLSPGNPLISAANLCRAHYIRCRDKRPIVLENGAKSAPIPLDRNVRSEQPKSRGKSTSNTRVSFPGGATPRNQKYGDKPKKSSSCTTNPAPPVANRMLRNGKNHDENSRLPSSGDEIDLSCPANDISHKLHTSDEWLSQVEMVTHEGPSRRLWMGPQFCFKHLVSTGSTHVLSSVSSALLSNQQRPLVDGETAGNTNDIYGEELDIQLVEISSPAHMQSQPVPTPAPRYNDIPVESESSIGCCVIEAGSGNFDRAAHMLEITSYGSLGDRCAGPYVNLRSLIAEAMEEYNGNVQPSNMLSSSPPFASTVSPNKKLGRTKSDSNDFESIPLTPDSFDVMGDDERSSIQLTTNN
ncbi:BCAS3 microtubule associated cell migration factor-like isoform X2 [Clavelina lepadiformis]|uniref:BCAS3 microtubule associated cell migration factor-like isoform X2 n=1 Tax=Clavelina lepadiformis TaxID=159417 RepID=UPI00404258A2